MVSGRALNEVIRRMRAIDAALPSTDGVAVFNRVYLQVTELVRDELRADSSPTASSWSGSTWSSPGCTWPR